MVDLAKYRLESAQERLAAAELEMEAGHLKDSINRSYYAFFHTIRSLLAEKQIDFKKHSAVISYFRQHYIKTGIFEEKFRIMLARRLFCGITATTLIFM